MPEKSGEKKSKLVAVRLTPNIKKLTEREARKEGMHTSEWIRNLIVSELRDRGSLDNRISLPDIEEER